MGKPVIITIANQKGGVGKTTTVVNLATSFALAKKKVLVIDFDYQANTTSLLGLEEEVKNTKKSITLAIRDELPLEQVLLHTAIPNLDAVGSDRELDGLREGLTGQPQQNHLLHMLLDSPAATNYDFIFIDTHPSLDCFFQSAMSIAHHYIIPLFAEADSANGLGHQVKTVEKVRKYLNSKLNFLGCVITRFDSKNTTHAKFEKLIREASHAGNFYVFKTVIPASTTVAAASAQSLPLALYKKTAPIVAAYEKLAREIRERIQAENKKSASQPTPPQRIVGASAAPAQEDLHSAHDDDIDAAVDI